MNVPINSEIETQNTVIPEMKAPGNLPEQAREITPNDCFLLAEGILDEMKEAVTITDNYSEIKNTETLSVKTGYQTLEYSNDSAYLEIADEIKTISWSLDELVHETTEKVVAALDDVQKPIQRGYTKIEIPSISTPQIDEGTTISEIVPSYLVPEAQASRFQEAVSLVYSKEPISLSDDELSKKIGELKADYAVLSSNPEYRKRDERYREVLTDPKSTMEKINQAEQDLLATPAGKLTDMIAYLEDFHGLRTGTLQFTIPESNEIDLQERRFTPEDWQNVLTELKLTNGVMESDVESDSARRVQKFYDAVTEMTGSRIPELRLWGYRAVEGILNHHNSEQESNSDEYENIGVVVELIDGVGAAFTMEMIGEHNENGIRAIRNGRILLGIDTASSLSVQINLAHELKHFNDQIKDPSLLVEVQVPTLENAWRSIQSRMKLEDQAITMEIGIIMQLTDAELEREYTDDPTYYVYLTRIQSLFRRFEKHAGDQTQSKLGSLLGRSHGLNSVYNIDTQFEQIEFINNMLDRLEYN